MSNVQVVRSTFESALRALKDCSRDPVGGQTILTWGNGLAVAIRDGQPYVTTIGRAVVFDRAPGERYPEVRNGCRELAKPMLRREAARLHAASLRRMLRDLSQS